ncbi:MAG: hypothetical protein COA49_04750 [Bacteroidetes bacterium]|nr:MAG: hypothetical protein COA49_04750 [Bacteroidota bacterium]
MRLHAPLLPYTISLWLGCTYGLDGIGTLTFIFLTWLLLGCWIGFNWGYCITVSRLILFVCCSVIGIFRSYYEINNRPFPDGELHKFTITSCRPMPISHSRNIYGYGSTKEIGKTAFIWPEEFDFPSKELVVWGIWNDLPEVKPNSTFNLKKYYSSLGCRGVFKPLIQVGETKSLITLPDKYRIRMKMLIDSSGVKQPAAGLLMGLSTGDKSWINKSTKSLFARSGIAHLLAVSGYHVGIVGSLPLLLFRSRRREIRWFGALGLAAIWAFITACGSPWSAVRAGLMVTAGCIGKWSGRAILPWQGLAVAAWIVVWIDPWAPQQLGTQLSFAATSAILATVSSPKFLLFRIPIAAQAATMSWAASIFKQLPIFFLPLNIIASVIVTLIGISLGIGSVINEVAPSLSKVLIKFSGYVVNICLEYLLKLDFITPLAVEIKYDKYFIVISLAVWGWLLQSTIPKTLSRLLSATSLLFILGSLLMILFDIKFS